MANGMDVHTRLPDGLDTPERWLNPFPWYATMRETDPVHYDDTRDRWDVFRYDDAKRVLSDADTFTSAADSDFDPAGVLGTVMVDADPPDHDRLRGVVDEYFQPGTLRALRPTIRSIVDDQLDDALEDGPDVEVISELTAPVTVLTIARLLGIPADQWDVIRQWSFATTADEFGDGDVGQLFGQLAEYFEGLIQERRQAPQDDLLSVIADPAAPLSEAERVSFCVLLFLAGHGTTTHAVGNALWTLAEQGRYEALRDGAIDRQSTFEEVLRYRGPVRSISGRRTTEAVELNGVEIPAGEQVTTWIGAANRDPRRFDEPDEFDPDRRPNPHIAFGFGRHYCLGAPLAKLEGDVILDAVTDRVGSIAYEAAALAPDASPVVYGLNRLPMRFDATQ